MDESLLPVFVARGCLEFVKSENIALVISYMAQLSPCNCSFRRSIYEWCCTWQEVRKASQEEVQRAVDDAFLWMTLWPRTCRLNCKSAKDTNQCLKTIFEARIYIRQK